jgi:hypothetical protein
MDRASIPSRVHRGARLVAAMALLTASCSEQPTAPSTQLRPSFDVAGPCTVSTLADAGAGSLRALVADVTCPIIDFDPALVPGTITLTSGRINIGRAVTIQGPGASLLAISGNES